MTKTKEKTVLERMLNETILKPGIEFNVKSYDEFRKVVTRAGEFGYKVASVSTCKVRIEN